MTGTAALLTDSEREVLTALAELTRKFSQLPLQHPSDPLEWQIALHRLQDLVASRPAYRQLVQEEHLKQQSNGHG